MGSVTLRYTILAILMVLLQVMVFNNILIGGYINPYVYVLMILLLPVDIEGWVLLVVAFFLGLSIDMFSDSGGMHAAATVFMAFCRPGIIRMISLREDFEQGTAPSINNLGTMWIFTYSFFLIFLHHGALFFLEIFRFTEILLTLKRIILSGAFSLVFVILGFYLIDRSIRRRRV